MVPNSANTATYPDAQTDGRPRDKGIIRRLVNQAHYSYEKPIGHSHMKIINAKTHGILDYTIVAIFALAPTILNLSEGPMLLAYLLAIVHLSMTLLTDFSMGVVKIIPLKLHGTIEFIVGCVFQ